MIGTTVSHYKITEKLGEGGMGEVYLAEDTSLRRKVALKFLPELLHTDQIAHKRFLREARSAAAIDHPYVCNIFEVSQSDDGQDFIVMEYVQGESLKEKLENGPLPLSEVLQIASEVTDALETAHKKGIVHRDLKPENIMITPQGHVKVMDFGLAKRVADETGVEHDVTQTLTREGTTVGTPAYMSPEQLRAAPVDHRSDIFSFGVVIYQMLTGAHPFVRPSMMETIGAILKLDPSSVREHVKELPEALHAIIAKMLAKQPEERFQDLGELKTLLDKADWSPPPLWKTLPWGKIAVGLAAAVMVVLLVLGFMDFWSSLDQEAESQQIRSIAVLPLANLMGDPEQEFFADGLTDALITDLSKIGALTVIAPRSVMRYKKTDKPLAQIAQELNVDAVIEGSVMREGNRVLVNAQLIEAATEKNLWGNRFERNQTSILALQSELVQAIAKEIQVTLTPQEEDLFTRTRQVNPGAHEACLKGMFHWNNLTKGGIATSLNYFEQAQGMDPDYAMAQVGIAMVWCGKLHMGFVPPHVGRPMQRAAAERAVELDDQLAEAHHAMGVMKTWVDWDWEAAEKAFRRGIELNPNLATLRAYYSAFLAAMQRHEEAALHIGRALEVDPFNNLYRAFQASHLLTAGRYDEAIEQYQITRRTSPNHPVTLDGLIGAYFVKGRIEEAFETAITLATSRGDLESVEALESGYEEGGFPEAMKRWAHVRATSSRRAYVSRVKIARKYVLAGENQLALDWLERGFEEKDSNLVGLATGITYRTLHKEPRYQELLRRMNFPDEVIAKILN